MFTRDSAAIVFDQNDQGIRMPVSTQVDLSGWLDSFLAFFNKFRKTSSSLVLSPVNSPSSEEIEEVNSIGVFCSSSVMAKEIAIFLKAAQ